MQFARPEEDLLVGAWLNEVGGTPLWSSISLEPPVPALFAESDFAPLASPMVVGLSSITTPAVRTGHIVRLELSKEPSRSLALDLTVELREGYVDEVTPGTLIHSALVTDVQREQGTVELAVPEASAATIVDYAALSLRFVADR